MAGSGTAAGPVVAKRRLAASSSAPTTSSRPKGRLADAASRPLRLRLELEDELFRPTNDVARPDQVLLGHHGVGEAAEDRADHGLQLEAGGRAAEAPVSPPSGCEGPPGVGTGDVALFARL